MRNGCALMLNAENVNAVSLWVPLCYFFLSKLSVSILVLNLKFLMCWQCDLHDPFFNVILPSMWALSVLHPDTGFRCLTSSHFKSLRSSETLQHGSQFWPTLSALLLWLYIYGWDEVFPFRSTVKSPGALCDPYSHPTGRPTSLSPLHPVGDSKDDLIM